MDFVLEALQKGETFEVNPRQPTNKLFKGGPRIGRADDKASSTLDVVFREDLLVTSYKREVRK
eukprot:5055240-Amphidinium_carterae.1